MSLESPERQSWDAIVVGTGMGGATIGHALAARGWRVVFCEQGAAHSDANSALLGEYPEMAFEGPKVARPDQAALLSRAGRAIEPIEDRSGPRPDRFVPFIGAGAGGSSALYGMALERFFPEDFEPARKHPEAGDSSLPALWPISYQDLAPYYSAAETLYGVRGGRDPLRPSEDPGPAEAAPPLSAANQELHDYLAGQGLTPYRLPAACRFVVGCRGCQGYLCSKVCKNDSAQVCLGPAVRDHGARLLSDCRVTRLDTQNGRVAAVECTWEGRSLTLTGQIVILAAGALASPALLLGSVSADCPNGLANGSDQVGRNLMRHLVDLYALTPQAAPGEDENPKELAFNDLYLDSNGPLGTVQSFGRLPPAPMIVDAFIDELRSAGKSLPAAVAGLAKPILRPVLGQKFACSLIVAGILEDLPHPSNRVRPGSDGPILEYRIQPYDAARLALFRDRLTALFKPFEAMLLKQAANNQRLAHVCGTCRFGEDPATSVLDPNNKAHELDNLYVVDSSFFPSSGGTNPSLTIAANALRVADHLSNS
ncbi:MAG: GMC family oxidoreductase [Pseudomonadota bacterium]